jgi:hypothetical protein
MNVSVGCTDEILLCVEEKYERTGTMNLFFKNVYIALEILYRDAFYIIGFEVLTAVAVKSSVFWNIAPCSPLKVS